MSALTIEDILRLDMNSMNKNEQTKWPNVLVSLLGPCRGSTCCHSVVSHNIRYELAT